MKRNTLNNHAMVYQYGSPSIRHLELDEHAQLQLQLQNEFWNALVELEHVNRKQYRDMIYESDATIASLTTKASEIKAQIQTYQQKIKQKRQHARQYVDDKMEKKTITKLSEQLKQIYTDLKAQREIVKIKIKPQLHALNGKRINAVKMLRQDYAAKGLYWGNYNAIIDSYETSRIRAMKEGAELRFHRFNGTGRFTCQIQGGITVAQTFACSTNLFQIDPLSPGAWSHPSRGERRRLQRTTARIRIGSNKDCTPIWFEIPIIMHRPIPQNALIKSVAIVIKKHANEYSRYLNITTVTSKNDDQIEHTGDVVTFNFGWRKKLNDNLRVAYWIDSCGKEGEIALDASYLKADRRTNSIKSIRDTNFNTVIGALKDWLCAQKELLPEWIIERTETISQWHAQARLAALILYWRNNRFSGDDEIFEKMEAWRKQDKHLWIWSANLRNKLQGRRLDYYRCCAKQIALQYDSVILDNFNLRNVRRKKTAENGIDTDSGIRNMANLAAVSILRNEIIRAMETANKQVIKKDSANITRICPFCNGIIITDPKIDILVTCGKCGKTYDQDWAAARNLWNKFRIENLEQTVKIE